MAKITIPDKSTGDQHTASEFNEVKNSVNAAYDELENKLNRVVTEAFSPVLTFDKDWKAREHPMTEDIVYSKAESGNIPHSYIEDYLIGDGTHTITIPPKEQGWYNGNDGVFEPTMANAICFYYDKNGRVRYTIENLEVVVGLITLSTPTGVYATSGGPETINTGCEPDALASSFNVFESTTGAVDSYVLIANVLTNTFQRTGLVEGATRYYKWQKIGDGVTYGNSGLSDAVSATTSSSIQLATPILYDIVTVDSITNQVNYSNISGETAFAIYRRNVGVSEWTLIHTNEANVLTYNDNTCTPEQAYEYSIIAKGDGEAVQDSSRSNIKGIVTNGVLTPILILTSGDGQITINWDIVDVNKTASLLQRSTNQVDWVNVEGHVSPSTSEIIDLNLTNGLTYYYRAAVSVGEASAYSVVVSMKPYLTWDNTHSLVTTSAENAIRIIDNALWPQSGLNDLPFSGEWWVKITDLSAVRYFHRGAMEGARISFYVDGLGKIAVDLSTQTSPSVIRLSAKSSESIQVNVWYHVVVTYDGSKLLSGIKIYLNGNAIPIVDNSSGTYAGLPQLSNDYLIESPIAVNTSVYLHGKLNLHRRFNFALSSGQALSLFGSGSPIPLPQSLINACKIEQRFNNNGTSSVGTQGLMIGTLTFDTDKP